MLTLKNITLIALTNKDFEGHKKAIDKSCERIEWGAVKLVMPVGKNGPWKTNDNIPWLDYNDFNDSKKSPLKVYLTDGEINDIDDWNYKIIYELHNYIQTDYAMLIHGDGYVIHAEAWRDEFLDYDYIGAPWPLPRDDYSYRDAFGNIVRVGNSVSIRSKRLMEIPSRLALPWHSYYGNTNEDGFITCHNRHIFEQEGCKFAPLEVAKYFSKEHEIPENVGLETFAFHSL